ncbi:hypothetical protein VNO78_12609 [Psophocarpus tetragonolobus]|uniref:Uncharacterized protein n=1 Tax=Psophocarpus tetragonolobus TaxID=3891 RepID=A0AAN9SNL7_PSOTE
MLEWEDWLLFAGEGISEGKNFPFLCLKSLSLSKCPKLRGNLPSPLPSLTEFSISESNQLKVTSSELKWNTSLEAIHIGEGGEDLFSLIDNLSYRELLIEKCDNLQSLPKMILNVNYLQILDLKDISSSISFRTEGFPTSLKSLQIKNYVNLEFPSHEIWCKYTSLQTLKIFNSCHSLTSFPLDCYPGLENLWLWECPSIEAITIQGGGLAPKLVAFVVRDCKNLMSLSDQIDLPSLELLWLQWLPKLASFSPRCCLSSKLHTLRVDIGILSSMSKHELGLLFQRLSSLSEIQLWGCSREEDLVNTLLKELLLPKFLQGLALSCFRSLKLLEGNGLQHLISLQRLHIFHCRSLESLPEDQLPSSLELLHIYKCPLLEARYEDRKQKYFSKIAHILVMEKKDDDGVII